MESTTINCESLYHRNYNELNENLNFTSHVDVLNSPGNITVIKPEPEQNNMPTFSLPSLLLRCVVCNLQFNDVSKYEIHKMIHKGTPPVRRNKPCPYCDLITTSKNSLERHIRRKHTFEKPFQCSLCDKGFATLGDKQRHEKSHLKDSEKRFHCGFCSKAYKDKYSVKKHERVVHSNAEHFTCVFCQHQSTDFKTAMEHKEMLHSEEKRITCEICKESFTELLYKCHIKTHQEPIHIVESKKEREMETVSSDSADITNYRHSADITKYRKILVKAKVAQSLSHKYRFKTFTAANVSKCQQGKDCSLECRFCYSRFKSYRTLLFHERKHYVVKDLSCKSCGDKIFSNLSTGKRIQTENREQNTGSYTAEFSADGPHTRHSISNSDGDCTTGSELCRVSSGEALIDSTAVPMESDFKCVTSESKNSNTSSLYISSTMKCNGNERMPMTSFLANKPQKKPDVITTVDEPILHRHIDSNSTQLLANNDEVISDESNLMSSCSESHPATAKFNCVFCGEGLTGKVELRKHQLAHTPPFYCKSCSKKYRHRASFLYHIKNCSERKEQARKALFCSFCNKQFKSKCDTIRHEAIHTKRIRHQCRFCSRTFAGKEYLRKHEKMHTLDKTYKCKYCDRRFVDSRERWRHQLGEHLKMPVKTFPLQCSVCEKGFSHSDALEKHMAIHLGQPATKCRLCGETFNADRHLKTHFREKHPGQRPFKCQYCNKLYSSKLSKNAHELTHTGEKPFVCEVCNKTIYVAGNFKKHMLIHQEGGIPKTHQCPQCGLYFQSLASVKRHQMCKHKAEGKRHFCSLCDRSFVDKCDLKRHELIHSGIKPYQCTQCGQCFGCQRTLHRHELCHAGVKPHKCRFCEKSFRCSTTRVNHERIHTNEKPFKCGYCDATFRAKSQRRIHERSHTGERPYPCQYCDKRFYVSSDRKRHERLHTGEKPYKCEQCDTAFTLLATLKAHIRNIHNDN